MKNLFTAILMAAMFAFAGTAFAAGPPPVAAPPAEVSSPPVSGPPTVPTVPTTVPRGNPDIVDQAQGSPPDDLIDKLFDLP